MSDFQPSSENNASASEGTTTTTAILSNNDMQPEAATTAAAAAVVANNSTDDERPVCTTDGCTQRTLTKDGVCTEHCTDFEELFAANLKKTEKKATAATTRKKSKKPRVQCNVEGCESLARSRGRCKRHGGAKKCSVEGCDKNVQSRNLCLRHGGGARCSTEGCTRAAQTKTKCKIHGGGVDCSVPGCPKKAHAKKLCRSHGGGARCISPGCEKWAQKAKFCMSCYHRAYGKNGEDVVVVAANETSAGSINADLVASLYDISPTNGGSVTSNTKHITSGTEFTKMLHNAEPEAHPVTASEEMLMMNEQTRGASSEPIMSADV